MHDLVPEINKRKRKQKYRAGKNVKRRYEKGIALALQALEKKLLLDEERKVVSAETNAESNLHMAPDNSETLEEIIQ